MKKVLAPVTIRMKQMRRVESKQAGDKTIASMIATSKKLGQINRLVNIQGSNLRRLKVFDTPITIAMLAPLHILFPLFPSGESKCVEHDQALALEHTALRKQLPVMH